jgi:hypothetical protein
VTASNLHHLNALRLDKVESVQEPRCLRLGHLRPTRVAATADVSSTKQSGGRLAGFAALPMQNVDAASKELPRADLVSYASRSSASNRTLLTLKRQSLLPGR